MTDTERTKESRPINLCDNCEKENVLFEGADGGWYCSGCMRARGEWIELNS